MIDKEIRIGVRDAVRRVHGDSRELRGVLQPPAQFADANCGIGAARVDHFRDEFEGVSWIQPDGSSAQFRSLGGGPPFLQIRRSHLEFEFPGLGCNAPDKGDQSDLAILHNLTGSEAPGVVGIVPAHQGLGGFQLGQDRLQDEQSGLGVLGVPRRGAVEQGFVRIRSGGEMILAIVVGTVPGGRVGESPDQLGNQAVDAGTRIAERPVVASRSREMSKPGGDTSTPGCDHSACDSLRNSERPPSP